jgi:hypothetical protein
MAKTRPTRKRTTSPTRKKNPTQTKKKPIKKQPQQTQQTTQTTTQGTPTTTAPAASGWAQKALPYVGVGTLVAGTVNSLKNKEQADWFKNHPFSAPAKTNDAVNPDSVTVNPKDVKQQGQSEQPSTSGSGNVSDGRTAETTPQGETGVGINATNEQDRQANLEADPNSSGRAWGLVKGGRYADATGRAVTNNEVAAGQQAYLNQHGMATARQRDMDFSAQMQDRNSPLFRQLDRMSGGLYTRQLEWQRKQDSDAQERDLVENPNGSMDSIMGGNPNTLGPESPATPEAVKTQASGFATPFPTPSASAFNVTTAGTGVGQAVKAQAAAGTPTAPAEPAPAPLDEKDAWVQQQMASGVTPELAQARWDADDEDYEPEADIGSWAAEREGQTNDTATNMTIGAANDLGQFADEATRVASAIKADGLGKVLTARSNLSGLAGKGAPVAGAGLNKAMAGLNVIGGLAAGWDEFSGQNYDPTQAAFSAGATWGESGNKGRRANAWGGNGMGSRLAGAGEATLNSLTMGGYDAMRANIWGGDEYMRQRGGAVDADPLNAGYAAEGLTDKLFGLWNDWRNPKSEALKAHEESRRRGYVAEQVKKNAGQPNTSGFRSNPYGV